MICIELSCPNQNLTMGFEVVAPIMHGQWLDNNKLVLAPSQNVDFTAARALQGLFDESGRPSKSALPPDAQAFPRRIRANCRTPARKLLSKC